MQISEKYRTKALACEQIAALVPNYDFKCAWTEIATEWHALAARRAQEVAYQKKIVPPMVLPTDDEQLKLIKESIDNEDRWVSNFIDRLAGVIREIKH